MSNYPRKDKKYDERFKNVPRSLRQKEKIAGTIRSRIERFPNRIRYTRHADKMLFQRGIDHEDVKSAIQKGEHVETRDYENKRGLYREVFEGLSFDENRLIRVVIRNEEYLVIITVIYLGGRR